MTMSETKRPTNTDVEEILGGYFPVLDHGFISLVDYMGGDEDIERAARVSYGFGTRTTSATRGLIRYLMRHRHTAPFEMVEFKFHVAMPLFVARQWIRQRMSSTNEYSGRYSLMPMLFYRPERLRLQSQTNRQGSDGHLGFPQDAEANALFAQNQMQAEKGYSWLTERDVSRELARIDLPLSTYTYWYWKIDLLNLFKFLAQRCDPHAQWEIRAYANIMAGMVRRAVPLAYEAWIDFWLAGAEMSHQEMEVLQFMLERTNGGIWARCVPNTGEKYLEVNGQHAAVGEAQLEREFGLTAREAKELMNKLTPKERPDFDLDLSQMTGPEFFEEKMAAAVPAADQE